MCLQHIQHLIPLGNFHRTRHRRYWRLGFTLRDKITRTRQRSDEVHRLQRLIRLLHGADAVLLTQAAHRRQFLPVTIQPLLNPLGKQSCQTLITRHAVFLIWTIQREKPVQMRLKNRMQMLF